MRSPWLTHHHSVANEQEENRFTIDTVMDEKTLREIYLRPFEMLVKSTSSPGCIMTAYNQVNGEHMDLNRRIIDEILRDEWKFQGLVMSDWGGTNSTVESVVAGCDLEMPGPPVRRGQKLLAALKKGDEPELEDAIDRSCVRILSLAKRMNLLGLNPEEVRASRKQPERSATSPEDLQMLRHSVANGHVLLKNDKATLPLDPKGLQGKKIAFIGPNARLCTAGGGGSASMNPQYQSHPLDAFEQLLKELGVDAEILHTEGAYSNKWLPVATQGQWTTTDTQAQPGDETEQADMFKVEFFASADFTGPIIETQFRNNSSIDLTDSGPFSLREAGKPYSVRITSNVTPKTSGRHHLSLTSVGHSRLLVDGQLVVDNYNWTERGEAFYAFSSVEKSKSVEMVKDQTYEVVIEAATKVSENDVEVDAAHVWSMQPSVRLGYLEQLAPDMVLDAVDLANSCDYTVLVIGLSDEWESEGYDRKTMSLPGNQNDLVVALLSQSKKPENLVIVNQSGSPVEMPWADEASTILQAWYGGQEAGNALADVLLGRVHPSGRLPITWPRRYADLGFGAKPETWPGTDGKVVYEEGTSVGYRWYLENKVEPQWWFGHGLEYTNFRISDLQVSEDKSHQSWDIAVNVSNKGKMSGQHVVQIYSTRLGHEDERELRSFDKTAVLAPEESQSMRLKVKARDMAHWVDGQWFLGAGDYVLAVSQNAGAAPSLQVTVSVPTSLTWEP